MARPLPSDRCHGWISSRALPRRPQTRPRLRCSTRSAAPRGGKGGAQGQAAASAPQQEARSAPEHAQPAVAPAATHHTAAPVSVLKSGVVEGMAYTLYSDGSIEAQLPQGTLRFGSISALRNHIENTP